MWSTFFNILYTGASLYAPYISLLISNKFWMGEGMGGWGVGGGESRGQSWRGRLRGVEQGGLVPLFTWAARAGWIKFLYSPAPPSPTVWALDLPRIHPVKVTRGLVCIKRPMHLWFVQPCALAYRLDAISQGPKTRELQGPTPSTSPPNVYARIQNIMHGAV